MTAYSTATHTHTHTHMHTHTHTHAHAHAHAHAHTHTTHPHTCPCDSDFLNISTPVMVVLVGGRSPMISTSSPGLTMPAQAGGGMWQALFKWVLGVAAAP